MGNRKNHPGHILVHGNQWRVILRHKGNRYQRSVGGTRKDAERFAREWFKEIEELAELEADGVPVNVTMTRLIDEYLEDLKARKPDVTIQGRTREHPTVRSYRTSLRPIRHYFTTTLRDPLVEKVRGRQIKGYLNWRRRRDSKGKPRPEPCSDRTIQKDRAILQILFGYACEMDYCGANPVTSIKSGAVEGREPVILSDAEYERLLAECEEHVNTDTGRTVGSPMLAMYALLLCETGMRCESEALWLQWKDIEFEGTPAAIKVVSGRAGHHTKTRRTRWVPITPRLWSALRKHKLQYEVNGPWVFHHLVTRYGAKAGERIRTMRDPLTDAAVRAELEAEWVPHDLRHRRCTTWLSAGKPVHIVQKAMGHASLKTTMHYYDYVREDLRHLVEEQKADEDRSEVAALV